MEDLLCASHWAKMPVRTAPQLYEVMLSRLVFEERRGALRSGSLQSRKHNSSCKSDSKTFPHSWKETSHSLSLKWTGNHTLGSGASLSLLSTCLALELPRRHPFGHVYRGCFQGGSNQGELTLKMGGPVTDRVWSPRLNSKGEKKRRKPTDCQIVLLSDYRHNVPSFHMLLPRPVSVPFPPGWIGYLLKPGIL